jgi:hypothetical protein
MVGLAPLYTSLDVPGDGRDAAVDVLVRVIEVRREAGARTIFPHARGADDAVLLESGGESGRIERAGLEGEDGDRARRIRTRPQLDPVNFRQAGDERARQFPIRARSR